MNNFREKSEILLSSDTFRYGNYQDGFCHS